METLDLYNLIGKGENKIAEERQKLLDKVTKLEAYRDWYGKKTKEFFKEWYCTIEKAFVSIGLLPTITSITKTGGECEIEEGAKLHFHINGKMTGRMKPIRFNGYTASGSGRNQKRLDDKAHNIEEHILASCPKISRVGVNCYSLEIDGDEKTPNPNVLIDLWF